MRLSRHGRARTAKAGLPEEQLELELSIVHNLRGSGLP